MRKSIDRLGLNESMGLLRIGQTKKNTNGKWIYRDPACVLSDNGKGITCNWCMNGKILAYDPSWLLADAME